MTDNEIKRETLIEVKKRLIEICSSADLKQELEDYIHELKIVTGVNKINVSLRK